jgi:hypothetical protein
MPRSNRPRNRRGKAEEDEGLDLSRVLYGARRVERKHGVSWNVQPLSPTNASKTYVCPGCSLEITPGTAHLVAWRADGLFGEANDLAERRHWHTHCWRIA